jgi:hypothetical protein
MNSDSNQNGKALITNDAGADGDVTFVANGPEVQVLYVDPAVAHAFYVSTAGPSDFSIRATRDSKEAIANGVAVFGAATVFNNRNGNVYLGDLAVGITALEVTHTKNGVGVDTVGIVAKLGGRAKVRAQKVGAVVSASNIAAPGAAVAAG